MSVGLLGAAGLAAGITALGGIGQSAYQGGSNRKTARANYKYGEKAAENAYARQLDFWNKQNEYNTYSADLQRLREAGLSPGLYYGSGAAGGSNAQGLSAVSPNSSAGTAVPPNAPNVGSDALQGAAQTASIRETESRADLNESQAEKNRREIGKVDYEEQLLQSQSELNVLYGENTRLKSEGQELDNEILAATKDVTIQNADVALRSNKARLAYYIEQAEQAFIETRFSRATFDSRVDLLYKDIQLKAAGIVVQQVQARAISQGIYLTQAQTADLLQKIEWYPKESESRIGLQGAIGAAQSASASRTTLETKWVNPNNVFNIIDRTANTIIRGLSAGGSLAGSGF